MWNESLVQWWQTVKEIINIIIDRKEMKSTEQKKTKNKSVLLSLDHAAFDYVFIFTCFKWLVKTWFKKILLVFPVVFQTHLELVKMLMFQLIFCVLFSFLHWDISVLQFFLFSFLHSSALVCFFSNLFSLKLHIICFFTFFFSHYLYFVCVLYVFYVCNVRYLDALLSHFNRHCRLLHLHAFFWYLELVTLLWNQM